MLPKFDDMQFMKDMNNLMEYSAGFLEGISLGKTKLFEILGNNVKEILGEFIDSNAKVDPASLHHVYEWYQTGSPAARLFDIEYTISNLGLSFKSTLSQSTSIKNGSNVPFYNKAKIMENGIPVTITPKNAKVLSFESNGETVFTKGPVTVSNPGGQSVDGSYERIFDLFFHNYFSQSFLSSSGLGQYLTKPVAYKNNLSSGKKGGRTVGIQTGYRWIANAGVAI